MISTAAAGGATHQASGGNEASTNQKPWEVRSPEGDGAEISSRQARANHGCHPPVEQAEEEQTMSDQTTSELDDQELWPGDRLDRAEVEIAAQKAKRAAKEQADKQAVLTAEQREAAAMKELGSLEAVNGRRKVLAEFGFDPGWR
jgi:hypothetical protein